MPFLPPAPPLRDAAPDRIQLRSAGELALATTLATYFARPERAGRHVELGRRALTHAERRARRDLARVGGEVRRRVETLRALAARRRP